MAKHGKKELLFRFTDMKFASFFLDFIHRKIFPSRVIGTVDYRGMLVFSIAGTPENVKNTISKIKFLYNRANNKYIENSKFILLKQQQIERELSESERDNIESGDNETEGDEVEVIEESEEINDSEEEDIEEKPLRNIQNSKKSEPTKKTSVKLGKLKFNVS